jgi:hypothetical protein
MGGVASHRRELRATACACVATGDRKGRDGVNPSTTHLLIQIRQMCRRMACLFAPRCSAFVPTRTHCALSSRLWGSKPFAATLMGARGGRTRMRATIYHSVWMFWTMVSEILQEELYERFYHIFRAFLRVAFPFSVVTSVGL